MDGALTTARFMRLGARRRTDTAIEKSKPFSLGSFSPRAIAWRFGKTTPRRRLLMVRHALGPLDRIGNWQESSSGRVPKWLILAYLRRRRRSAVRGRGLRQIKTAEEGREGTADERRWTQIRISSSLCLICVHLRSSAVKESFAFLCDSLGVRGEAGRGLI